MTFKKGDRVEGVTRTGIVYGFVQRVGKGGSEVTMVLDDGRRVLKGNPKLFKESTHPVPEDSPFRKTFTEPGERVRIADRGRFIEGYVISGDIFSAKVRSGLAIYTAPQAVLSKSEVVPPVDPPSPMDKWSIGKYRANEAASQETTFFTAEILLDGKKVIDARNDGHGGCNFYHGPHEIVQRFMEDARAWAIQHGEEDPFEPDGTWVDWAATAKPYKFTATEYFAEMRERYGEPLAAPGPR
jgi:hypothetical protein